MYVYVCVCVCVCVYNSYGGAMVKNLPANAGDTGNACLILMSIKYPGEGPGNLL